MKAFYYNTNKKLREIFKEHCNLSVEQFEELDQEFLYLVTDYQEEEPKEEIKKRTDYLAAVIDFLFNTKELNLEEHTALINLLEEIGKEGGQE